MLFFSFFFMIFSPTVPVSAWVGDGTVMNKKGDIRNMDTVRPRETSGWSGEQSWKAMRRLRRSSNTTPGVRSREPDSISYWEQKLSNALRRAEGGEQSWRAMRRLKKSSSRTPDVWSQEPETESKEKSWKAMRRLKKSYSRTPDVWSQEPEAERKEQSWKAMRRLKKVFSRTLSQTPEASNNFLYSSLYSRELPSDWLLAGSNSSNLAGGELEK